mmetsp:Transcript_8781/g.26485  ORF Transcript_8781/g.26485 Transcript_8781/m.26485 type:complete len:233 (-) Transcript_8781:98-796(-)
MPRHGIGRVHEAEVGADVSLGAHHPLAVGRAVAQEDALPVGGRKYIEVDELVDWTPVAEHIHHSHVLPQHRRLQMVGRRAVQQHARGRGGGLGEDVRLVRHRRGLARRARDDAQHGRGQPTSPTHVHMPHARDVRRRASIVVHGGPALIGGTLRARADDPLARECVRPQHGFGREATRRLAQSASHGLLRRSHERVHGPAIVWLVVQDILAKPLIMRAVRHSADEVEVRMPL